MRQKFDFDYALCTISYSVENKRQQTRHYTDFLCQNIYPENSQEFHGDLSETFKGSKFCSTLFQTFLKNLQNQLKLR